MGKRATLWLQEFYLDLEDLEYVLGTMKLLGSKGTTGTQASFLELFDGDQEITLISFFRTSLSASVMMMMSVLSPT